MIATLEHKGRTQKEVWVEGITDEDQDAVLAAAFDVAGETRSSLMGFRVHPSNEDPTRVKVTLYTD